MLKDRINWPQGKGAAATIGINLEGQYFAKLYYPDGGAVQCPNVNTGEILQVAMEGLEDGLPVNAGAFHSDGITTVLGQPVHKPLQLRFCCAERLPDDLRFSSGAAKNAGLDYVPMNVKPAAAIE